MQEDFLHNKIRKRLEENSLRRLTIADPNLVDFCSNDYLGISRNNLLGDLSQHLKTGATGSRLLSGNYPLIEEAEQKIAAFHDTDAALIFNSGYDANLGLLGCIAQRGDTILYDKLSHASIRDGLRLSFATSFAFAHNDMGELEILLRKATGTVFIVTESVFSMDGDYCPLEEMVTLASKFNANLVIDEAHATGVIGAAGEGLVQSKKLANNIFARIHTFGKACGTHGAAIVGSLALKEYLINFARPFIYSTALPEKSIADIIASYELFPGMKTERARLTRLIELMQSAVKELPILQSSSPIQGLMMPGNEEAKAAAVHAKNAGFDIRPILYPTVPKGAERLRIVLHAFNTELEVTALLNCLKNSCSISL
jgi:8-amino-7-oxononanoate synthase